MNCFREEANTIKSYVQNSKLYRIFIAKREDIWQQYGVYGSKLTALTGGKDETLTTLS